MSWEAEAWARRQRTGSMALKAVLVSLSNWINPRNDWFETSIRRLADELETSERSVQRYLGTLEEMGFIERQERFSTSQGGRQGWNAYRLRGYAPPKLSHIEPVGQGDNLTPSPVTAPSPSPVTVVSPPIPTLETIPPPPSGAAPKGAALAGVEAAGEGLVPARRPARKMAGLWLPADWTPPPVSALPPATRTLVEHWPPGAFEVEAEAFRAHFTELAELRSPKGRHADWDRTFASWLRRGVGDVARNQRLGVAYPAGQGASAAVVAAPDGCADAASIKQRLREVLGDAAWGAWVAPCRLELADARLVVRGMGARIDHIRRQWTAQLKRAADGREIDFVVEKSFG